MNRLLFLPTLAFLVLISTLVRANSDTLLPIQKNGKWGFINQSGKLIIPCEYESALNWGTRKWGKVKINGKWININRLGDQLTFELNGTPKIFNDSLIVISSSEGEFLCDDLGNKILNEAFTNIKKLRDNYFTYQVNDSIGLACIKKGKLTSAKYDAIESTKNDSVFKVKICGYVGLIDNEGKEVIPIIYNELKLLTNKKVLVIDGIAELEGVFDLEKKRLIISPLWNKIGDHNSWFTILQNNNQTKVYFSELDAIDSLSFEMATMINNLVFAVKGALEGVLNERAEVIVPFECSELLFEHSNLIAKNNSGYNLLDQKGKSLIKGPFSEYHSLETPNYLFKNNDEKWTLYDSLGNSIYKNLINPTVQKNIVKSKNNGEMTRIELDKVGKIQEKTSFNNVVSLKVDYFVDYSKYKKNKTTSNDSNRIVSKRWFLDKESGLFGLKSSDGKTLIKPKFNDIEEGKSDIYTIVYLDTEDELITYGKDQFLIKFKAGLVHNETGKILIPVQYAGIRITGDENDPLIFAITRNFRFQQYLPKEDKMGVTYLWVDETKGIPVRALKKDALVNVDYNKEMSPQCFNFKMLGFKPMHVIPHKSRYYSGIAYYKSADPMWTYLSSSSESPVEFLYAYAEPFNKYDATRVIDKSNNKWGLINRKLKYVVPPEYSSIELKSNKHYLLSKNDSVVGIVYDNSRQVILENANKIVNVSKKRVFYRGKKGAGFWSKEEGEVLGKEAEDIRDSYSSLIPIKKSNKWGFMDENGVLIIECKYTKVNPFKEGFATVKIRGKWKLIDEQGNEIKELPWKSIKYMGDLLIVSNGNNWKVSSIGDTPDLNFPTIYGFRKIYRSSFFWCKGQKHNFIINSDGSLMIKTKHENAYFLGDSTFLIAGKKRQYLHFGDKLVKTVPRKTDVLWVKGNMMGIQKSGKMYLCDTSFQLVSTKPYRSIKPSPEGNFIATDRKLNYVIDGNGNVKLNTKLRIKENTKKNFNVAINEQMKLVFIDSTGKQTSNGVFKRIISDGNSNFWVLNGDDTWGLLDPNLEWIIEPRFKQIQVMTNGFTKTYNESIFGYCDLNGNSLVPAKYTSIEIHNNYFKAEIGDEVHWFNKNGSCIYGPDKYPIAEK